MARAVPCRAAHQPAAAVLVVLGAALLLDCAADGLQDGARVRGGLVASSCRQVQLDEDSAEAQPVPVTGASLVVAAQALLLFGGTIQWEQKGRGGGLAVRYGHVLWRFDPDEAAWDIVVARRGRTASTLKAGDVVEAETPTGWVQATVLEPQEARSDGKVLLQLGDAGRAAPAAGGEDSPPAETLALSVSKVLYTPPAHSMHAAAVYKGMAMYVFGGKNKTGRCSQDLHRFDLDQQTWRLEDPAVRPPPREMHTLVDSGNRMILYGGTRGNDPLGDCWAYTPKRNEWKQLAVAPEAAQPLPRWGHTAEVRGNSMFVFGGMVNGSVSSELWTLDLTALTWSRLGSKDTSAEISDEDDSTEVATANWPSPRKGHASAIYGSWMLVSGGHHPSNGFLSDLWALDLKRLRWQAVPLACSLPPRNFHTAAVLGSTLYIHGGNTNEGLRGDFWTVELAEEAAGGDGSAARDEL